jgi:hypothetical protein
MLAYELVFQVEGFHNNSAFIFPSRVIYRQHFFSRLCNKSGKMEVSVKQLAEWEVEGENWTNWEKTGPNATLCTINPIWMYLRSKPLSLLDAVGRLSAWGVARSLSF